MKDKIILILNCLKYTIGLVILMLLTIIRLIMGFGAVIVENDYLEFEDTIDDIIELWSPIS